MLIAPSIVAKVSAAEANYYLLPEMLCVLTRGGDATPLYAAGLQAGWRLDNWLSVEGELGYSLGGGRYRSAPSQPDGRSTGRYRMQTQAAYTALRLPLAPGLYAKGRIGLVYERVQRRSGLGSADRGRAGLSAGLGAGYVILDRVTLELALTVLERQAGMLGLGMHYRW